MFTDRYFQYMQSNNLLKREKSRLECFVSGLHTRDHQPGVVAKTIEYFAITKEPNSQGFNALLQHGCHFTIYPFSNAAMTSCANTILKGKSSIQWTIQPTFGQVAYLHPPAGSGTASTSTEYQLIFRANSSICTSCGTESLERVKWVY